MDINKPGSVFIFSTNNPCIEDAFLLRVPTRIQSTDELFTSYGKAAGIGCFGDNWDAFLDYLRDFTWIPQREICIFHEDLPLLNDKKELRTYLEVLEDAVNDWEQIRKNRTGPFTETADEVPYVEHELFIVFPISAKDAIDNALDT